MFHYKSPMQAIFVTVFPSLHGESSPFKSAGAQENCFTIFPQVVMLPAKCLL